MQPIERLSDISQNYHSYIIDLWGVMHDGVNLDEGAYACIQALKAEGKKICFLSNAPETANVIRQKLTEIGIDQKYYDALVTSGEVAKDLLLRQREQVKKAYFIGIEAQKSVLNEAGIEITEDVSEAAMLLCSGIYNDMLSIEDYCAELDAALIQKLPMYCVNPDRIVYSGHYQKLVICAGEMAHYYKEHGGEVHYTGKPYVSAYEACRRLINISDYKGVLAIGDAFETDVQGAHEMGIDALFIACGIHADELQEGADIAIRSENIIKRFSFYPRYVMEKLA